MITKSNTTTKGNTNAGMGEFSSSLVCSTGEESPFETIGKTTTEVPCGCDASFVAEIDSVFSDSAVAESDSWVASGVKVDVEATGEIKKVVDVGLFIGVLVLAGCVAVKDSVLVGVGDGPMVGTV